MTANPTGRGAGNPRTASVSRDPRLDPHLSQLDLAFDRWHARLVEEVRGLVPARLGRSAGTDRFAVSELISGIGAHDLYHAGQIRLIRRMCGAPAPERASTGSPTVAGAPERGGSGRSRRGSGGPCPPSAACS